MLFLPIIFLIFGFCLLIFSADRLIDGASSIAQKAGLSSLTIGLTIVALGTSLPEMVVSAHAALYGNPDLAVGNVIGSNIANIGLVLGIAALIMPLEVHKRLMLRELPILFFVMLFFGLLIIDGELGRFDGLLLAVLTLAVLFWILRRAKDDVQIVFTKTKSTSLAVIWLILGLVLMPISSHIIVKNAVYIARSLGISDLVIGLTIFALGTSLPELATAVVGARKKQYDLVIGNIIGSNIFNLLVVLILPAFVEPVPIADVILKRDVPIMIAIAAIFYLFVFFWRRKGSLGRLEGGALLLIYVCYLFGVVFLT